MFNVNNKNTSTTSVTRSCVFVVNFEHISHFFTVSIVNFEQVNLLDPGDIDRSL